MPLHPNVQAVQDALESAGAVDASGRTSRVRLLPEAVHTAPAAADALGVQVGQIANSLIFDADGEPLLVLTSGAHRVDTGKVARLIGATALKRARPEFVREHTGQPIGGVAPIHPGVRVPMRVFIDTALMEFDEVWAGGGVPEAIFPITPDELARITNGKITDVA
jgi:prolyl-tRNA editing enzyme YbaK/EbsC (Cys-tRNA(Pro) deacylase)